MRTLPCLFLLLIRRAYHLPCRFILPVVFCARGAMSSRDVQRQGGRVFKFYLYFLSARIALSKFWRGSSDHLPVRGILSPILNQPDGLPRGYVQQRDRRFFVCKLYTLHGWLL